VWVHGCCSAAATLNGIQSWRTKFCNLPWPFLSGSDSLLSRGLQPSRPGFPRLLARFATAIGAGMQGSRGKADWEQGFPGTISPQ